MARQDDSLNFAKSGYQRCHWLRPASKNIAVSTWKTEPPQRGQPFSASFGLIRVVSPWIIGGSVFGNVLLKQVLQYSSSSGPSKLQLMVALRGLLHLTQEKQDLCHEKLFEAILSVSNIWKKDKTMLRLSVYFKYCKLKSKEHLSNLILFILSEFYLI